MALDNVDTDPYYIFGSGLVPEDVDASTLSWSAVAPASNYDWSGVAVRQTSTSTTRKSLGALITRKHLLVADHNVTSGLTYTYIASDGTVHTRVATVLGGVVPGLSIFYGTDMRILSLDSELPVTCKTYSVLTNQYRLDGYGILVVEPGHEVILRRIANDNTSQLYHAPTWQQLNPTGSGNPLFAAIDSVLYLLGTNWSESYSVPIGAFADEVDTILATDGSYAVTRFDAPVVETRRNGAMQIMTPYPAIGL